jgi:hypothetical protein
LFGVTEGARHLEAQAVVGLELVGGECHGAAEEDDMRPGVRMPVGRDDEDAIQRVRERVVEPWGLLEGGSGWGLRRWWLGDTYPGCGGNPACCQTCDGGHARHTRHRRAQIKPRQRVTWR